MEIPKPFLTSQPSLTNYHHHHIPSNPSLNFSAQTYLPNYHTIISSMATCAVSMAMPLTHNTAVPASNSTLFNPLRLTLSSSSSSRVKQQQKRMMVVVQSSLKEKAVTAAALTASMVVPDVAEAASGVTPSLNNFLLSIGAGGVVLAAILGAIIGVSNFDPVKRG